MVSRFALVLALAASACKQSVPAAATLKNEAPPAGEDPCDAMKALKDPNFVRRGAGAAPAGSLRVGLLSWASYGPGEDNQPPRQILQKNAAELKCLVRRAAREGAKVVVTPELALVGYGEKEFEKPDDAAPFALHSKDPLLTDFGALARELKVHVVLGFVESAAGATYYNAAAVFAPSGELVLVHRKGNLTPSEEPVFKPSPARQATTFVLPGFGKVGVGICADVYGDNQKAAFKAVPDLAAIFVSSAWSGYRYDDKGQVTDDRKIKPDEKSRGRVDYEALSAGLARQPPVPVVVANHVDIATKPGEYGAGNDVGIFGIEDAARFDGNESFLAIVDVPKRP